jgi:hypothetical protein
MNLPSKLTTGRDDATSVSSHNHQIQELHIELPVDRENMKGLCLAILRAVDKAIPNARYVESFTATNRPSTEKLISRTESVLHLHCVGMLICNQAQNPSNVGRKKDRVMTELVRMSDILNVPLVFSGIEQSSSLFGLNFHTVRRSGGLGAVYREGHSSSVRPMLQIDQAAPRPR